VLESVVTSIKYNVKEVVFKFKLRDMVGTKLTQKLVDQRGANC